MFLNDYTTKMLFGTRKFNMQFYVQYGYVLNVERKFVERIIEKIVKFSM